MNWEAVVAMADLIGAVGVIVTLAYLAVQIRRNTHVILCHLRSLEGLYVQRVLGPIAVNAWESRRVFIDQFASWRAVRGFWFGTAVNWGWDQGFKTYVDRVMNDEEREGTTGKAFGEAR